MTARRGEDRDVEQAVRDGKLERVAPSVETAELLLSAAQRHLKSAEHISDSDPEGGYALAYDAGRKAAAALLAALGLRVRNTPGHHRITAHVAAKLFDTEADTEFGQLERMRRRRNAIEYPEAQGTATSVDAETARTAIRWSRLMVTGARRLLDSGQLGASGAR